MRKYPLHLGQYGISIDRQKELVHFCLQYPEMKRRYNDLLHTSSRPLDGMPHGSGKSDPVGVAAAERDVLRRKMERIEQSAIEASADMYQYVIRGVTGRIKLSELKPPCGRRQWYEMRTRFFRALDKKG